MNIQQKAQAALFNANHTVNLTTDQKISGRILVNLASGMSMREALDDVLGAGTFDKVTGELYDALRAQK